MFYKDLNKRFTEIVTEYMMKGYYMNTSTMRGSQGEISKVDLTDGKEIIRVLVEQFNEYGAEVYEGIQITVGRVQKSAGVTPNTTGWLNTIWNDHLEVISFERFYQVGIKNRNGNAYYGTREESREAMRLQSKRRKAREVSETRDLPESAKAIVLPYVRRQPKCSRKKVSDITNVYHYKNGYKIDTISRSYVLH